MKAKNEIIPAHTEPFQASNNWLTVFLMRCSIIGIQLLFNVNISLELICDRAKET
ncbi:hypothetical protein SAMN05192534_1495 [Alteribacillus persepolensis]|uniref:Uncharacterized protein n=1 Tax=Alteribacillus persepolensis TaxID=568899 RepID=A0A1G8KH52_9BACI|nr:hypothetical protein [Alteribacillus persepolensis]SDI42725.1 hypothetical protein SAMN05192534_1495 [Alteribacillus persepolensis]